MGKSHIAAFILPCLGLPEQGRDETLLPRSKQISAGQRPLSLTRAPSEAPVTESDLRNILLSRPSWQIDLNLRKAGEGRQR